MRDLSRQNDPGAPIEATPGQKASIESRREVLQKAKLGGDGEEIARAKGALDQRRRALYVLLVADVREKYFAEMNRLRAEGESTDELRELSRPTNHHSDHAMVDIGSLMQLWTGEAGFGNRPEASEDLFFDDEKEDRTEKAMLWLYRYISKLWSLLTPEGPVPTTVAQTTTDVISKAEPKAKKAVS